MTADLTAFLLARVAEAEERARAATTAPWLAITIYPEGRAKVSRTEGNEDEDWAFIRGLSKANAEHIAANDPIHVLAQCAALRTVVELHGNDGDGACASCGSFTTLGYEQRYPCPTLLALAQPYADHPDFEEAWQQ